MPTGGTPARLPQLPQQTQGELYHSAFALGVPDHSASLPGRAALRSLWMLVWLPALGVRVNTARMPGLIEQKPSFGCRKESELLPHSRLASALSFCPFAGFGAILLAEVSLCSVARSPEPGQWAE